MEYGIGDRDAGLAQASDLLERALEIDPDYVDALTGLALAYWRQWTFDGNRTQNDPRLQRSIALAGACPRN